MIFYVFGHVEEIRIQVCWRNKTIFDALYVQNIFPMLKFPAKISSAHLLRSACVFEQMSQEHNG